jgi:hypothetical protein
MHGKVWYAQRYLGIDKHREALMPWDATPPFVFEGTDQIRTRFLA